MASYAGFDKTVRFMGTTRNNQAITHIQVMGIGGPTDTFFVAGTDGAFQKERDSEENGADAAALAIFGDDDFLTVEKDFFWPSTNTENARFRNSTNGDVESESDTFQSKRMARSAHFTGHDVFAVKFDESLPVDGLILATDFAVVNRSFSIVKRFRLIAVGDATTRIVGGASHCTDSSSAFFASRDYATIEEVT
jgi:hypothetical protein